jgi:hypothetical protein
MPWSDSTLSEPDFRVAPTDADTIKQLQKKKKLEGVVGIKNRNGSDTDAE